MNRRLRLLVVLGLLVLLMVTLAGCNRERPAVTNDKGTPVPGRGTVAAPAGSVTPLATDGDARSVQPATSTAPSPGAQQGAVASPQTSGAASGGESFNYTVATGDNLAAIAARFGVTVDAVARLNSITDPNAISPGQVLKIPGSASAGGAAAAAPTTAAASGGQGGTYTVQPGDSLGRIAQRFGTTTAELVRLNNLANPDQIRVGQKLAIPGATRSTTGSGQAATGQGRIHTVARGETLGTIAKQYGVTVRQIQDANAITNPDRIYVGQKLTIP